MISTKDHRTVVLNLQTGDILQPSSAVIQADHAAMARAAERYGFEAPPELENDPFSLAQQCVEQAKKVISRDKYHLPFVWLFHPGGLEMIVTPAEDRQHKYFGREQ